MTPKSVVGKTGISRKSLAHISNRLYAATYVLTVDACLDAAIICGRASNVRRIRGSRNCPSLIQCLKSVRL